MCTYTAGYLAAQCTLVMRDSTQTRPVIKEANWSASIQYQVYSTQVQLLHTTSFTASVVTSKAKARKHTI